MKSLMTEFSSNYTKKMFTKFTYIVRQSLTFWCTTYIHTLMRWIPSIYFHNIHNTLYNFRSYIPVEQQHYIDSQKIHNCMCRSDNPDRDSLLECIHSDTNSRIGP